MEFSKRMKLFGDEIFAALNEKKVDLEAEGRTIYNLSVGTPDFAPAPHIVRALAGAAADPENWKYSLRDLPELLEAVCAYYKRRFGVEITPAQVASCNGSQEGCGHIGMALCDEGDTVLLPNPCYPVFIAGAKLAGAEPWYYPLTKEHGFLFNGATRKIKGVCMHHDLGPLGAALNKAALIRQIKILKEMGCDGIRTSHNMPSTMLTDLCDSLGMFVMAESFDSWKEGKTQNAYSRFYDEWWEKDLTNLIFCHRNHPSIIMWSIGNEIPEQNSAAGAERCRNMVALCHKLDPTRPVTAGMNSDMGVLRSGFAQALDIFGINYHIQKYEEIIDSIPQGFILGAETASALSSRGVYKFPVRYQYLPQYPDLQVSSYDYESVPWGNIPEDDGFMQDDKPWVVGEFVWTGFDYLGEPTPYFDKWPARSSYFGIIDLAGLPKDRYYWYRSRWNTSDNTIHLLPHWTWPGREG